MSAPPDKSSMMTPFAEAVRVTPIPGSDTAFSANIPWDWCGEAAAHGGYTQSLIFSTARTYFQTKQPSRKQPDPIASHVQFLERVQHGAATLVVQPVKLGGRVSIISIALQQRFPDPSGSAEGKHKSCVIATVTQGNLASENGLTLPTEPTIPRREIPDRAACEEYFPAPFIQKIAPASAKLVGLVRTAGRDWTFSDHRGRSNRELWYSFLDGTGWDVLSLGYLTDVFGGAPNNYTIRSEDYKTGVIYPTISMATEIKKDPKGAKWLFMRMRAHAIKNGRFDTEVQVVDEEGGLVALGKHVSLVVDRGGKAQQRGVWRL